MAKYLLSQDRKFIVIEHFNQDAAEECFDCQRKAVCRNDNPLLHQFEYNDNTIRLQESIAPVTGNSRGADKSKRHVSWCTVDHTPLQKRMTIYVKLGIKYALHYLK